MRYFIVLMLVLCMSSAKVFSQTYALNSTLNGQTITTCSGTFYDSNLGSNYTNNQDYTVTFCPGTPNTTIKLDFFLVDIALSDSLIIYDGQSTAAPVLVVFDFFNNVVNKIAATNPTGCLTIRFKSDAANVARGWQATIKCVPPCQAFTGTLTTTPAPDANGVVNVCLGDSVKITANITYPNNGFNYTQSDNLSRFSWTTGFANDTAAYGLNAFSKKITVHAGYRVKVSVTDSNGCSLSQPLQVKVRTSAKPKFSIQQPPAICLGDTTNLSSLYQLTGGSYIAPPFSGNSLFLPDGSGVTYSDTIRIRDFASGQTLTKISDFLGVFMTMEHSYLGDLEIKLIAPNGASVILKQYPGGAGTFLGEPVDVDSKPNIPGIGYLYGFTPNAAHGTMLAEANLYRHTFTDASGVTYTNQPYLPAGNYTSFASLNGLIGTSLNGNWIIQIKDNLASDNGYIFNWYLSFAQSLYPNPENYVIGVHSLGWQPAPGLLSAAGTIASASPLTSGSLPYVFRIIDSANCTYDTSVNVIVNPLPPKPDLGADKTLCPAATVTLDVLNAVPSVQYQWSSGQAAAGIQVNTGGIYNVTATNSFGCKSRDTVEVIADPGVLVHLGADTMFCASSPNVLKGVITGTASAYKWNDGSTNPALPITAPGKYWLEVASARGCKASDTINVINNPVNNWQAPNDTSICGTDIFMTLSGYPAGTGFTWSNGGTGTTQHFTVSGIYGVTANYIGCLKQDNIDVGIHPIPVADLGNDTMYCESNPNILKPSITGNIASFIWSTGATTAVLPINTTGTYWLEVTTAFGCKDSDTITVSNNPINAWTATGDSTFCDRNVYIDTMKNYPAGTSFAWYDGTTANNHAFTATGNYKVTAIYAGCQKKDSIAIFVKPLPEIELGRDSILCNSFVLPLKVSYPGATYTWSTGVTDSAIVAQASGTYWVRTLLDGCTFADTLHLTYVDCSCGIFIPNAFSPNGDGINEKVLVHIRCDPKDYLFSIYDRYGQPVFNTTSLTEAWTGEMNGRKLPVGTYYYILTLYNPRLFRKEMYKGYIVLLK